MTNDKKACVEELLPCPFCGGRAFYGDTGRDNDIDDTTMIVACRECDATIERAEGVHEAVAAWNNRAAQDKAQVDTKDCREAFEQIQRSQYGAQADSVISRDENGLYENRFLFHQWIGFQAAWVIKKL